MADIYSGAKRKKAGCWSGTARTPTALPQRRIKRLKLSSRGDNAVMADNSTFERVRAIIVDQLGVDPNEVTMEANFRDDLEADSLDLVELIMAFEEEFGGEINDDDAQKITTVGDAVRFLDVASTQA
jgi:acyl carrier protein